MKLEYWNAGRFSAKASHDQVAVSCGAVRSHDDRVFGLHAVFYQLVKVHGGYHESGESAASCHSACRPSGWRSRARPQSRCSRRTVVDSRPGPPAQSVELFPEDPLERQGAFERLM